jgi:hypothetical protein
MKKCVEIRSYNLKPGTRAQFDRAMTNEAVPMLLRWQVDVVSWGPSPHDEDSYYLIRSYASLAERQDSQDRFYGSDEWRQGPREGIVGLIDSYTSVVIEMGETTIAALRREGVCRT